MIRTRIAPSPTGENLHIGNVYAALLNFAFAKKNSGQFIVRIEDTDRTRFIEGSEERILDSLDWLGITPDESTKNGGPYAPYRQSERLSIYHEYAQKLLDSKFAYFAYYPKEGAGKKKDYTTLKEAQENAPQGEVPATPKTIAEMPVDGDWVIKMRVPKNEKISFTDVIRGEITFDSNEVSDQVLIKSDKFPTYHFAVVVDDYLMKISHVIRAEEWISSTPKHILLYNAFGWELPIFAHIPILRNPDKSKLSKRKNPVWVSWYKEEGFLPVAILNYLALMGWSHPEEKEIFPLAEFIEKFDLSSVKPVGPVFDLEKLKWMNGEYIRSMELSVLKDQLKNFYAIDKEIFNILESSTIEKILELAQTRMRTFKEFKELVVPVNKELSEEEKKLAHALLASFKKIEHWEKAAILAEMKEALTQAKAKGSMLYSVLTGREKGLPLPEMLELEGKEKTLNVLQKKINIS